MPGVRRPPAAVVAVVLAVLCLVALASCGGVVTDEPTEPAAPTTAPPQQPAAEPASPAAPASPTPTARPSPTTTPSPTATPSPAPTSVPDPSTPAPSPSPPAPTSPPTSPPAPHPAPDPPARDDLRLGDEGQAVLALQERLVALGYWLPAVDGVFGDGTHHAVVALQKAAGIARDGIVGPITEQALAAGPRPQPRSTAGTVIEIDRSSQLLLLVTDGELRWVFDTSTGRPGLTTPSGQYRVWREIDGYRYAPLGVLYRPKYFNSGIAIHGYPSVPPYPASHGCVRVTNAAMDWFWAHDEAPVGRTVWVY